MTGGVLNSQPLILIWQQILGLQTELQCASVGLSWQTNTHRSTEKRQIINKYPVYMQRQLFDLRISAEDCSESLLLSISNILYGRKYVNDTLSHTTRHTHTRCCAE